METFTAMLFSNIPEDSADLMELATHVEGLSVDDEGLVLLVGEELRRVADVDRGLLLVPRQNLWKKHSGLW